MSRRTLWIAAAGVGWSAAFLAGLLLGPADISVSRVLSMVTAQTGLPVEAIWPRWQETIVVDVRLPRTLLGLLVGGGLSVAGTAMQGFFRNPLAEPGIVGVSAGAALGGVFSIFTGLAAQSVWLLPFFTFLGGIGATWTIYAVTARQGRVEPNTLLLAGVALGVMLVAATSFLISVSLADWQVASQILQWTMGGLGGRNWDHVKICAPIVLAGVAVVAAYARDLDALVLGEVQASSVGVDVPAVRRNLIAATAAITGATVAVAGPIGFVGLVVPHVLRLLLGPGHRLLIPVAALAGGTFLVSADIACRLVLRPEELQLGILTAMTGGPLFVYLLLRRRSAFGN